MDPTASPTPSATPTSTTTSTITSVTGVASTIATAVAGIAANPILVGVSGLALVGGILALYFIFKAQITKWLNGLATDQTQTDETNVIQGQGGESQDANQTDNDNRNDLNGQT